MDNKQNRKAQALRRIREFLAARINDFPENGLVRELFETIVEVLVNIDKYTAQQFTGSNTGRSGTSTKLNAYNALKKNLIMISRTAKYMAYEIDGLENKFRMPRSSSEQALLAAARAFAADAAPLYKQFLRHQMPENFLEELNNNIIAMEQAINTQITAADMQVTATASLDEELERALIARRRLNPLVKNRYYQDSAILTAWNTARRIESAPHNNDSTENKPPAGTS